MKTDPEKLITAAVTYYKKGNLPQAELYCRQFIKLHGNHPDVLTLLGMIALSIRANDFAVPFFEQALVQSLQHQTARQYLEHAKKLPAFRKPTENRFLLIKAWGYGFWADVDHVIGQLMLAEMTDRVPVIHWGENSLFRGRGVKEAFSQFFEPVSQYQVEMLAGKDYTFYPPKWSEKNLLENDVAKWSGAYSRVAGIYLLNRDENVLVSDFFTPVRDLIPWLKQSHPLYGQDIERICRYLLNQYIKLKPDLEKTVDQFWKENLRGRDTLAVHVRGSDKQVEMPDLEALNKTYHVKIKAHLEQHPDAALFLLTDSSRALNEYQQQYDDRLIVCPCQRTDSKTGLHYQERDRPEDLANEVIVDAYLAARCDAFIGNGFSNVSQTILHLKEWAADQCFLCGHNMLNEPNFYLHEW